MRHQAPDGVQRSASRAGSPTLAVLVGQDATIGRAGGVAQHGARATRAAWQPGRRQAARAGTGGRRCATGLSDDTMTTKRSAAAATIRSRVCAPPPPLTSQPAGSTWSAPSMARSRRSMSRERPHVEPVPASASSSVAGEVATQVMSRPRRPSAGTSSATVVPGAEADRHAVLDQLGGRQLRRRASRPGCRVSRPRACSAARHVLPGRAPCRCARRPEGRGPARRGCCA